MIEVSTFHDLIDRLGQIASDDIKWSEGIQPPAGGLDFANEAIFVICNSGMKNTVACRIYDRVMAQLNFGESAGRAFGHEGKAAAIDDIWNNRNQYFLEYRAAADKVEYLATLPWIGNITKWHLAKNFGADVAKPDVHLQRLADRENTTPQALCERLAKATGYRIATVDVVLWRACANGILDSRSGAIQQERSLFTGNRK